MGRRFTILGESGSGKTCYLFGMYLKMRTGIEGYTVDIDEMEKVENLSKHFNNLKNASLGIDRFPPLTDTREQYGLTLKYNLRPIKFFDWVDYPGGFLQPGARNIEEAQYKEVERDINTSDVLFICIDGANLVEGTLEDKIDEVTDKSAFNIMPYISAFVANKGVFPPIAIVVTKWDLCKDSITPEELQEVISSVFRPLFGDNKETYVVIIPVSLGANIKDNNYTGKFRPQNIDLPILFGIECALEKDITQTEHDVNQAQEKIPQIDNEISECRRRIDSLRDDIAARERWISSNNDLIAHEKSKFFTSWDKVHGWENDNERYRSKKKSMESDITRLKDRINDLEKQRADNIKAMGTQSTIPSMQDFQNRIKERLTAINMVFRDAAWQQKG